MDINPTLRKPHIVFLFSDTGGGHRSAAEAIIEAVQLMYGKGVTTEMVDFFMEPLILDRASSYIGVMIDDLVLQGGTEPYRTLTARALQEHGYQVRPASSGLKMVQAASLHQLPSASCLGA